jgi:hypothetical protein
VQRHEASGRMVSGTMLDSAVDTVHAVVNLYIANHAYCIDGWEVKQSQKEIQELLDHASQPKYTCEVEWENPTDLGKSLPPTVLGYSMSGPLANESRTDDDSDLGQHLYPVSRIATKGGC